MLLVASATDIGKFSGLAFVDLETTGLSPTEDRIAEIGVITVDGDGGRAERWATLVRTPARRVLDDRPATDELPRFADIATSVAHRLAGRLFVAHNARFDYSFLRAEFERVGIAFEPPVVCSLMLSRLLYPHLSRHDLDSLIDYHALRVETRHRALPDADLVWQWWQLAHRQLRRATIARAIDKLLTGPVLPPQLDASLVDRLPTSPGAYLFHGARGEPIAVGAAGNLRAHVINYFRLDKATGKALDVAQRITDITWRATRGMLGAQLRAAALADVLCGDQRRRRDAPLFSWQMRPSEVPCIALVPLAVAVRDDGELFGLFSSERKSRNALVRMAHRYRLCHGLLGLCSGATAECAACPDDQREGGCARSIGRKQQLVRVFKALQPMRVVAWPHGGPIGIRERGDLHVIDQWQFLGTARRDVDVYELLACGPRPFDRHVYRLLHRNLGRIAPAKLVDLNRYKKPSQHADFVS
jgi:DNA polymerase-3 subunit epsilon